MDSLEQKPDILLLFLASIISCLLTVNCYAWCWLVDGDHDQIDLRLSWVYVMEEADQQIGNYNPVEWIW